MAKKSVLALGIDPAVLDASELRGFTAQQVRHFIDAQIDRVRALGFEVTSCLIDLGGTAEATTATTLKSQGWDCVVIGAGLREPPERLLLFERVLNLVHASAPNAPICFNTKRDAAAAEAVMRWVTR